MKNVKILTLNNHDEWDTLVNNCQKPDIHFTTQYMKNFEEVIGGIQMLFVLFENKSDNYVLYPFYKRRINDLPEFSNLKNEYYDIISPWYFGGKLNSSKENCVELSRVFDKYFKSYMDKERIVSEFTRIHPLTDSNNEYAKSNNGKYNYDISFVDLTESIETVWGDFNKANKNAINSAIRKKINVKFSNSNESLKNFFG